MRVSGWMQSTSAYANNPLEMLPGKKGPHVGVMRLAGPSFASP
jgi:hypothetical protein